MILPIYSDKNKGYRSNTASLAIWSALYRCLLQGVRTVVGLPLVSN